MTKYRYKYDADRGELYEYDKSTGKYIVVHKCSNTEAEAIRDFENYQMRSKFYAECFGNTAKVAITHAWMCGKALAEVKEANPEKFDQWLERKGMDKKEAERLMDLASKPENSKMKLDGRLQHILASKIYHEFLIWMTTGEKGKALMPNSWGNWMNWPPDQ